MEVAELNTALEQREKEYRERKEDWRLTNYIIAKPYFDPKRPTPSIQSWMPFPWDKEVSRVEWIPYDERIEFALRKGREDWIPNYWFERSTKYKHLCRLTQESSETTP